MKKILVTGGAGFLGSNLCKRLLDEGNKVFCLDNFFTGRMVNIQSLMRNKNFVLVRQNVIDKFDTAVDEIYNLACPASPIHYQQYPVETTKTSVLGIINMLELATKFKGKLLQASTSEIYGDPLVHPQKENYQGNVNPIGIRACYDESKRVSESLCFDYHREYGTKIKVIRIFNTYGPNMGADDGRVVSNFICQALKGEDITIYGDGSQTRSFCYVDDLIDGMIRVMNSDDKFLGPVNLGNPGEFTVKELAEKVITLTHSHSKLSFQALPQDDPAQRRPDIDLAREKLSWEPKVMLKEGLVRTIDYFKSLI